MARIFLYLVTGVIVLVIAGLIMLGIFWEEATQFALSRTVPSRPFETVEPPTPPDYASPDAWAARPGIARNAAEKIPAGTVSVAMIPEADVFFIHPTTYGIVPDEHGGREALLWNAPIDDAVARPRTEKTIMKNQASAFNLAGRIFAPHYRQATFGAFFTEDNNALMSSLAIAYSDVARAFAHYIAEDNDGRPFILASHSQGAIHALSLLKNRIADTALADRMIAAYVIGWPVSVEEDLGALTEITACKRADQTRCVLSWQSFGADGEPANILEAFDQQTGLSGKPKAGSTMLCTNPLTGTTTDKAVPRSENDGAVAFAGPDEPLGAPIEGLVGARCGGDGILYLQPPPDEPFTEYVLFGDNYHVYDINLFYMDLRADAVRRTKQFMSLNRGEDTG